MAYEHVERPGVRTGYDIWADTYDETPNPLVYMDERYTQTVLAPRRSERILDAGCGTGRHLRAIEHAGAKGFGLDYSLNMLRQVRRKVRRFRLAQADLQRTLPLTPGSYDAVLCALVGEHLTNLRGFFREAYGALRHGGRFVFSVWHPEQALRGKEANFLVGSTQYRLGALRHTVSDYETAVEDAGLELTQSHTYYGDAELADAVPDADRYLNEPLMLVLLAERRLP